MFYFYHLDDDRWRFVRFCEIDEKQIQVTSLSKPSSKETRLFASSDDHGGKQYRNV